MFCDDTLETPVEVAPIRGAQEEYMCHEPTVLAREIQDDKVTFWLQLGL